MGYYEIAVDKGTVDSDVLEQLAGELNTIVLSSGNIDKDAQRIGFMVVGDHIALQTGVWGLVNSEEDDLISLSEDYPEYVFGLTRVNAIGQPVRVTDLQHFSLEEFQDGESIGSFTAAPITWIEE